MPAAELTRLRMQINGLIARFDDPEAFHSALRDLLDLYSNRAYRPGQVVKPQPLLPSFHVPPLIMQQLEMELVKTCQEWPEQALAVVEALWHDPNLEPRQLAARLLGAIPPSLGREVTQTLKQWARPDENFRMLDALFRDGTVTLRKSTPNLLLALFEEWLSSSQNAIQSLGIRGMVPMIEDPDFENLPPVFRMLSPLVSRAPMPLHTDLQAAIEALTKRTPIETAYFLRQTLSISTDQGTARLIRRCLPLFNADQQASLRSALRAANIG